MHDLKYARTFVTHVCAPQCTATFTALMPCKSSMKLFWSKPCRSLTRLRRSTARGLHESPQPASCRPSPAFETHMLMHSALKIWLVMRVARTSGGAGARCAPCALATRRTAGTSAAAAPSTRSHCSASSARTSRQALEWSPQGAAEGLHMMRLSNPFIAMASAILSPLSV